MQITLPSPLFLDEDLLLRSEQDWVAVTDLQAPVVELLLDRLGRMVTRDEIRAVYETAGGSSADDAVYSLMRRVGAKFQAVGAHVVFAPRGRGLLVSLSRS